MGSLHNSHSRILTSGHGGDAFMRAWTVGKMEVSEMGRASHFSTFSSLHLPNIPIAHRPKDLELRAATCTTIQGVVVLERWRDAGLEGLRIREMEWWRDGERSHLSNSPALQSCQRRGGPFGAPGELERWRDLERLQFLKFSICQAFQLLMFPRSCSFEQRSAHSSNGMARRVAT